MRYWLGGFEWACEWELFVLLKSHCGTTDIKELSEENVISKAIMSIKRCWCIIIYFELRMELIMNEMLPLLSLLVFVLRLKEYNTVLICLL